MSSASRERKHMLACPLTGGLKHSAAVCVDMAICQRLSEVVELSSILSMFSAAHPRRPAADLATARRWTALRMQSCVFASVVQRGAAGGLCVSKAPRQCSSFLHGRMAAGSPACDDDDVILSIFVRMQLSAIYNL